MIDQGKYEELRGKFRAAGEISPELYSLLGKLVKAVVFGARLAPAYSMSRVWDDEAVADALHGWIEKRLLRTNALLSAFDLFEQPGPFFRSLEQNFRHYLENERERGELGNLIARSNALLRDDEAFTAFVERRKRSENWWGLSAWDEPLPFQGSDVQLVSIAYSLGEFPLFLYSQDVERASPILSASNLRRFLVGIFEAVGALLTLSHFANVLSRRFDLGTPPVIELQPELEEQIAEDENSDSDHVEAAAISLISELRRRQVEAILLRHQGMTLEEIAERLGVSRGTADNALRSSGPVIDKYCVDGITRGSILEKVLDALS